MDRYCREKLHVNHFWEFKGLSESFLKQEEIIKICAAHEDCSTQTNSKHGKRGLIYGTLTSISAFSEGLKMNKKTQLTQKDPKLMVQV